MFNGCVWFEGFTIVTQWRVLEGCYNYTVVKMSSDAKINMYIKFYEGFVNKV